MMAHVTYKLLAALLVCAALAPADNYPRQPGIDVQHYILRVTLSDDTDQIQGETTVQLRFVRSGVTSFALDLATVKNGKGMTVDSVTADGAPLPYTHENDRLTIRLATAPAPGDLRSYTVKYHGIAAGGLKIVRNKFGDRCLFSVNWPVMARQWLPMVDHPYDKATSEFLVTAPARYQVVANGGLAEEIDLGDGRRLTHWKQDEPIASWLNNIGVAQFAFRSFDKALGIPLQSWVFHQDRDNGIVALETPMRQAIEFYSDYVGPYPYDKLGGVEAAGMGGGMEHASAIFYGERAFNGRVASSLVWHEVAHQWFGDSVTESDWDDAWLSEGFATYFANLSLEHYEGRDAFVAALKNARTRILRLEQQRPVAVVHDNLPEISGGSAPVQLVYQKGGWFLHMLRGQVGTETFWKGMREYYRRFRDSNATTKDLRQVFEEVSGQKLDWFFQQWLYRADSPQVEGTWTYDAAAKKINIDLRQTQPGEPFHLIFEVGLAPDKLVKIDLSQAHQTFAIAADKEPAAVALDPSVWELLEPKFTRAQ